jgi:alpha-galactosidase
MQRRRFLQLTGLSTAALFFNQAHGGAPSATLHYPANIALLKNGSWFPLVSSASGSRWTLDDLIVDLQHTQEGMRISLHAPSTPLEKIRLGWPWSFPGTAVTLGDAWERSYGDLSWDKVTAARKAPWYLLVNDGTQTHGFGVRTGAAAFCYWQATPGSLDLVLDTHSGGMGVLLGDRTLQAAEIVTIQSTPGETPFATDHRFCKHMCLHPRLPQKPVYGINDWYFAYGNNSRDLILRTTKTMADLVPATDNRPFSVIDDGWETEDFMKPNAKFGDMAAVAAEIKKLGMRPGVWTRALLARSTEKPANLIQRPGADGKERYLDPTIPENLHRIGETIALYRRWGFEMVKHDYSTYDALGRWGSGMMDDLTVAGWHFNDRSRTNAEIFLTLYRTIREAAGTNRASTAASTDHTPASAGPAPMYLIGCNTVSHLSAGFFELNRIGDDTSGREWSRTVKMGVNTLGFRLPQHNAFYAVDGDCVGLTTQIPWEKNKQWMQLLAGSSAPLFISAQPEATGPEQRTFIKKCFARAAAPQPLGQPLDWMTNPHPAEWLLDGEKVHFYW